VNCGPSSACRRSKQSSASLQWQSKEDRRRQQLVNKGAQHKGLLTAVKTRSIPQTAVAAQPRSKKGQEVIGCEHCSSWRSCMVFSCDHGHG
jgi:hypothetical protein